MATDYNPEQCAQAIVEVLAIKRALAASGQTMTRRQIRDTLRLTSTEQLKYVLNLVYLMEQVGKTRVLENSQCFTREEGQPWSAYGPSDCKWPEFAPYQLLQSVLDTRQKLRAAKKS